MENRFKQLRYEDKMLLHQKISISKLAEKMEISKATISKLENNDDYDARISIIRKYKEQFPDVSFDFLMGATGTQHKQYNHLEEVLPFSNKFYENIEALFRYDVDKELSPEEQKEIYDYDTEVHRDIEYLLESIVSHPGRLSFFLLSIYKSLFKIYVLENPYKQSQTLFKEENTNIEWFNITQNTINFLKEVVSPQLQQLFETDRQVAIERQKKIEEAQKERLRQLGFSDDNIPF